MGGNAFENTDRLTAEEYSNICDDIGWLLRNVMSEDTHFCIPPSVREKADFGDVDILVVGSKIEDSLKQMKNGFMVFGEIKNPSGYNLLVNFEGKRVQIDLNKIADNDFRFGKEYFAWNDLGNLIGRIAHRQGLKFGHDGLWYIHNKGSQKLGEIQLTRAWYRAIDYLGFDVHKYSEGFDTYLEMFEWVKNSKYFDPCAYPLEHRNHQARMRDSKRKTYNAFLKYVNFDQEYYESDKAAFLEKHKYAFILLGPEIAQLDKEYELNTTAKEKMNGGIVQELTGLTGKNLGQLMQVVKRVLPRDMVLKHDSKTIEAGILFAYEIWRGEQ